MAECDKDLIPLLLWLALLDGIGDSNVIDDVGVLMMLEDMFDMVILCFGEFYFWRGGCCCFFVSKVNEDGGVCLGT